MTSNPSLVVQIKEAYAKKCVQKQSKAEYNEEDSDLKCESSHHAIHSDNSYCNDGGEKTAFFLSAPSVFYQMDC